MGCKSKKRWKEKHYILAKKGLSEESVQIEMERLRSFENHPFKVRADSQMIELQESVERNVL